jgi:hypothetical protein
MIFKWPFKRASDGADGRVCNKEQVSAGRLPFSSSLGLELDCCEYSASRFRAIYDGAEEANDRVEDAH